MGRIPVVLRPGGMAQGVQQVPIQGLVVGVQAGRETGELLGQPGPVRGLHLRREDPHAGIPGRRVLHPHHKIRPALRLLQQIRRHEQGKQAAAAQHPVDVLPEALPGGQKFIVPDGNILQLRPAVDQAHQLVGQAAVLLAVAQKDIGIKSGTDPFGQLVADQHGVQVFFQLLGVGDLRRVRAVGVQILQGVEPVRPAVELVQPALQQNRQDRDMLLQRKGKIGVHGPVGLGQQTERDRDHKEVHALQVGLPGVRRELRRHVRRVIYGAVVGREQIPADLVEGMGQIRRVTGKIHPGLPLGAGVSPRPDG